MHITKDLVAASATPLVLGILAERRELRLRDPQAGQRAVRRAAGVDRRPALPAAAPPGAARPRRVGLADPARGTPPQVLPHHRPGPGRARRAAPPVGRGRRRAARASGTRPSPSSRSRTSLGGGTMTVDSDDDLESQIAEWRAYMHRRRELHHTDAEELEDHLRSRITELTEAGLRPDEAFLIAVKRMGSLDELSREFAREHSERLWKQLVLPGRAGRARRGPLPPRAARSWSLCAAVAALAIKVPAAVRARHVDDDAGFYARNFSLFALPAAGRLLRAGSAGSARASSGCSRCCSSSARSPRTRTRWPRTRRPSCSRRSTCRSRCGWWSASPTWAATGVQTGGGWTSSGSPASG